MSKRSFAPHFPSDPPGAKKWREGDGGGDGEGKGQEGACKLPILPQSLGRVFLQSKRFCF